MYIDEIKLRINNRWSQSQITYICFCILDALISMPYEKRQMLTFDLLLNTVNYKTVNIDFIAALNILVHSENVLEQRGVFVDKDKTEYEITKDKLQAAFTGQFVHPLTGEYIPDNMIIMFFNTTKIFENRLQIQRDN